MKKKVPDDIVLVVCGIFGGVLYLWTHQYMVYRYSNLWLLIGPFIGMVCVPMFYSSYIYFKNKK